MTFTITSKRQLYRFEGGFIYIDATNSHQQRLQSQGNYEPAKAAFLRRWWKPYHVFIDVGASCGYFTMLAAAHCPLGYVHAIEPEPENVHWIDKAIKMNDYQHVRVYPMAAADYTDFSAFFLADDHGQHSLNQVKTHMRRIEVEVKPLDSLIHRQYADCIKIDVEGMEMAVLNGAKSILKQAGRMAIVMDLHPEYHDDNPMIGDLLRSYGFRLYDPRSNMKPFSVVPYNCHELIAVKES